MLTVKFNIFVRKMLFLNIFFFFFSNLKMFNHECYFDYHSITLSTQARYYIINTYILNIETTISYPYYDNYTKIKSATIYFKKDIKNPFRKHRKYIKRLLKSIEQFRIIIYDISVNTKVYVMLKFLTFDYTTGSTKIKGNAKK